MANSRTPLEPMAHQTGGGRGRAGRDGVFFGSPLVRERIKKNFGLFPSLCHGRFFSFTCFVTDHWTVFGGPARRLRFSTSYWFVFFLFLFCSIIADSLCPLSDLFGPFILVRGLQATTLELPWYCASSFFFASGFARPRPIARFVCTTPGFIGEGGIARYPWPAGFFFFPLWPSASRPYIPWFSVSNALCFPSVFTFFCGFLFFFFFPSCFGLFLMSAVTPF